MADARERPYGEACRPDGRLCCGKQIGSDIGDKPDKTPDDEELRTVMISLQLDDASSGLVNFSQGAGSFVP
jgi:hypothetical protein